jgi:hypothetical protein
LLCLILCRKEVLCNNKKRVASLGLL